MKKNIGIVLGSFHKKRIQFMLEVAREKAKEFDLFIHTEVWVPGALEKPLALKRLLLKPNIQGAVVLGIIERGETKHGLVMGQTVIKSILEIQLEFMKPIGVGILGPEILEPQIEPRLHSYAQKAVEAVFSMLQEI